jgi:hypothetical protein
MVGGSLWILRLLPPLKLECNLFTVISLGTMKAACDLLEKASANILDCLVIIELSDLKGREKVPKKVSSLMQY